MPAPHNNNNDNNINDNNKDNNNNNNNNKNKNNNNNNNNDSNNARTSLRTQSILINPLINFSKNGLCERQFVHKSLVHKSLRQPRRVVKKKVLLQLGRNLIL